MASHSPMRVTRAELVATLSLVSDLGMGRPMERVLRQTVIAMRLGTAAGMEQATCASEIDLSAEHAQELRGALARYVGAARRAGGGGRRRPGLDAGRR